MRARSLPLSMTLTTSAVLMLALAAQAADLIPKAFPRSRYVETLAQSPFALAETRTSPNPPSRPDAHLTGLGKLDDGRDWVAVKFANDPGTRVFIGTERGKSGASVTRVNWGGTWRDTNAVIDADGERMVIKFRELSAPENPKGRRGSNETGPKAPGGRGVPPVRDRRL